MKIIRLILVVSLATSHVSYPGNVTQIIEPVLKGVTVEKGVSMAISGGANNLIKLAATTSPQAVDFGVYSLVSKLKHPAIIVLGTEAAILLTLSCSNEDPFKCLSSFISLDSLQAATDIAVQNAGAGVTYALGEEMAKKALALSQGSTTREIAGTVLTTFTAAGLGFYAWSMDPSLDQAMLLSMCSAVIMTSLTSAGNLPALKGIKQQLSDSLSSASTRVGKLLGVATLAAGTLALAYPKSSSEALLGAVINISQKVVSPTIWSNVQKSTLSNTTWIQGYRWTKWFTKSDY
jgi:hypothetical protein